MSTGEEKQRKKHPVLGLVLGLLGIAAAGFAIVSGAAGGAVALALGAAALILGMNIRNAGGSGTGAMMSGILAIILAVALTLAAVNSVNTLKKKAADSGAAPLLSKYTDMPYFGILGVAMRIPGDEESQKELQAEMDLLKELDRQNAEKNAAATAEPAQ